MTTVDGSLVVLNLMDASLADLAEKGVMEEVASIYNPSGQYGCVLHFTPHRRDLAYGDALKKAGIEVFAHDASGLSPLKILRTILRLRTTILRRHVDIVRGRLPYLGSAMGAIAARWAGVPFVVSLGGDNRLVQERNGMYNYNSRWISWKMEEFVLSRAHAIICPNQFTIDYVARIAGPKAKQRCRFIPWLSPAIDTSQPATPTLAELRLRTNVPTIPVIGFINQYKYSDVLFDALDALRHDAPALDFQVVFCGDGPLKYAGEKRFDGDPRVRFLGWTEKRIVNSLLRQAAFVAVPMSGFVLLEAASVGKPVISSHTEWHSELIRHEDTGLLVDPEKPQEWAAAFRRMLTHTSEAHGFGQALRKAYEKQYSIEKTTQAERDLYLELKERGA